MSKQFHINNQRITLRALREMVGATIGKPLPTAKALRESEESIIASIPVGRDGLLTVYKNGFYIYKTDVGSTVYAVDRCANYAYDGGDVLALDDENWALHLVIKGEDRLEHNNDVREGEHFPYGDNIVDRHTLPGQGDFVDAVLERDQIERLLGCLTDKQRLVVQMYFFEGMKQEAIACRLKITQRAVSYALNASVKRIKKLYPSYF